MILPQHQPSLPNEMPHAYLVRTGAPTAHEYDHHEEMLAARIVDQMGCLARRDQACRDMRNFEQIKLDGVKIRGTDLEIDVVVFYDGQWVTHRPSQFDWSEREYWECYAEGVYDRSTWEDVTALVDLDSVAEQVIDALRD